MDPVCRSVAIHTIHYTFAWDVIYITIYCVSYFPLSTSKHKDCYINKYNKYKTIIVKVARNVLEMKELGDFINYV